MKTKLQGLCPLYRSLQAFVASIYLLAAVLLASCTTEADKASRTSTDGTDSINKREVLLSFKNKLTVKATKADTQATTKADVPIATEAENEIATLDVYVFGAKAEGDTYTFRERFSYRQDGSALPAGAKELNLTPSTDNATTTALLELQKGLFVRLYCIANQTELINSVDGSPVADTYFTPLTYDMKTGVLTDGIPTELQFQKFHSPLLTNAFPALSLPLPMAGAQTTPIDLTDFGSSARVQVGFKLTRTMARFDVSNIEADSKFHLESISMGNGRRGTTFFPVKVYGATPAADGELITYPARAFEGKKANTGLQVSAFYSYPSPLEDKGYLILNGTYQVNQTEAKEVSYKIPFVQKTTDGGSVKQEITSNHRYTIGITKADEYKLDFTLKVDEWDEGGNVDDYEPGQDSNFKNFKITVPAGLTNFIEYDANTREATLSWGEKYYFIVEVNGEPVEATINYSSDINAQWLAVTKEPLTKAEAQVTTYKIACNKDYKGTRFPRATIRFVNGVNGDYTVLWVKAVSVPIENPEIFQSEIETSVLLDIKVLPGKEWNSTVLPDWLSATIDGMTIFQPSTAMIYNGPASIRFIVAKANPYKEIRNYNLTINENEVILSQKGSMVDITIGASSLPETVSSGVVFNTTATKGLDWVVSSVDDWITIDKPIGTGTGIDENNTFGITVNPNASVRQGTIVIHGGDKHAGPSANIVFTQRASSFSLSNNSLALSPSGGNASTSVTATAGLKWTITKVSGNYDFNVTTSGTGNGTVSIGYTSSNTSAQARYATYKVSADGANPERAYSLYIAQAGKANITIDKSVVDDFKNSGVDLSRYGVFSYENDPNSVYSKYESLVNNKGSYVLEVQANENGKLTYYDMNGGTGTVSNSVKKYCESLGSGWRVPMMVELYAIRMNKMTLESNGIAVFPADNVYWSSTRIEAYLGQVTKIISENYYNRLGFYHGTAYVRCVREVR